MYIIRLFFFLHLIPQNSHLWIHNERRNHTVGGPLLWVRIGTCGNVERIALHAPFLMGSSGGKIIMATFPIPLSLPKESHVPKTRVSLVETTLVIMPPVYIDGASRSPRQRTGFGRDVYTYYGSYGVGRRL